VQVPFYKDYSVESLTNAQTFLFISIRVMPVDRLRKEGYDSSICYAQG